MRHPVLVWIAGIGALVALDIWADRNDTPGDSLSEVVRQVYRTETPMGRVRFIGSWAFLTSWFIPHIIKKIKED